MLQVILAILLLLVPEAYAQSGVVTSMQRPGGVPQRVLDKLKALEDKYTTVSGLFAYIDARDGNASTCTGATVGIVEASCTSIPRTRDNLIVSFTNTNAGIASLSAGATAYAKLLNTMNGQGCATASGWYPCTTDNLRTAFTLRNSTAASTGFGGTYNIRHLGFDGGHALRVTTTTAVTSNMCSGFTSSSGTLRGEVVYHGTGEGVITAGLSTTLCGGTANGAVIACCRY